MRRMQHLGLLAGLVALTIVQACGGCQEPPPEPPPKPVQGNAAKPPQAPPQEPPPEAKEVCAVLIFSNFDQGPTPLTIQFTAEGDCTAGIAKFEWDFGDGSPGATGEAVIHTFEKAGTYTVKGKITSDELPGVEDVDDLEIVVIVPSQG